MPPAYVVVPAFVLACGWLARLVLPYERAVRVRNAFLLRRGQPADLDWTPSTVPGGYRLDHGAVPEAIAAAVTESGARAVQDDWERARMLVTMLVKHSSGEGAIRADLGTTWIGIVSGIGYCADYVRVYLAAAREAGLFCRQWAFSFDGFGGHGHTFVEVFDRGSGRWLFLDVHNNICAIDSASGKPLGAQELRRYLFDAPDRIEFQPAGPGRLGFPFSDRLLDYYQRGAWEWFLWWGNDVVAREKRGFARLIRVISRPLAHRAMSVLGTLPPFVVIGSPENEPQIARMEALRRRVLIAASLAGALGLAVLWLWVGGGGRGG